MKAKKLIDLGLPPTGAEDVIITADGAGILITFSNDKNSIYKVRNIIFVVATAYRFRDEMHSLGRVDESYESLAEIMESDWIKEIKEIEPPLNYIFRKRHFALFLIDYGYYEIISSNYFLDPKCYNSMDEAIINGKKLLNDYTGYTMDKVI